MNVRDPRRGWAFWMGLVALTPFILGGAILYWAIQDARRDHRKYKMVTTHSEINILGWKIKSSSTREVPIDEQ